MDEILRRIRLVLKRYEFPGEEDIKQLKERIEKLAEEIEKLKKHKKKKKISTSIFAAFTIILSIELFFTPSTPAIYRISFDETFAELSPYSHLKHNVELARKVAESIVKNSKRTNLDPYLIICMIEVESSFRSKAISKKGALGLMQVKPSVANSIAHEILGDEKLNLFDPEHNIAIGTYYLSKLLDSFGDLETALLAYNLGPTRVRESLRADAKLPLRYVNKIKTCYKKLTFNQ